ncbi:cysteine hydrolase family protein [Acinetobacter sp. WU_MDCI_Axc73]|nr:cysteine hydrolase family protein [Acinetobacter sp. WU_MDCI_Axc73]
MTQLRHSDPLYPIGSYPHTAWQVNKTTVSMLENPKPVVKVELNCQPQHVIFDLNKTAIMIIDMQNDFCTAKGWVDHIGGNYEIDRKPIAPLQQLLPTLRAHDVPVVWVNWGNRSDLANSPANQHHLYKPTGVGIGLGEPLPEHGAKVLEKNSWAASIVDELCPESQDILVDKYRISGFWDTELDSILRNLNIKTILFAGVNTDQCVLHTLTDANFLGYGCILLEDCCATSSPDFCTTATLWNVKKCFGFISNSNALEAAISQLQEEVNE